MFALITEYLYRRCQVSSWEVLSKKDINEMITNKVGNAKRPKKAKKEKTNKKSWECIKNVKLHTWQGLLLNVKLLCVW